MALGPCIEPCTRSNACLWSFCLCWKWGLALRVLFELQLSPNYTRKQLIYLADFKNHLKPLTLTPTFAEAASLLFWLIILARCSLAFLMLFVFIWETGIEQIFSLGLSLPTDTGRGLSEQGEASRDTLSESSSLRGPSCIKIKLNIGRKLLWMKFLPFLMPILSSKSDLMDLNMESSESPSIPSQFSALWMLIKSRTSCSSVLPPISPPRPFSGPNTSWLYRGSFTTG